MSLVPTRLPQQGLFGARADQTTGLPAAFTLPGQVENNERLRSIYTEMVESLRSEAAGIAMTTVQAMLVERIAATFVLLKHHEENNTFLPRQEGELNKQFHMYAAEFNKLLIANHEQQRSDLLKSINDMVNDAVDALPDENSKRHMWNALSKGFAKLEGR